jgi:uncharacterized protein YbcI
MFLGEGERWGVISADTKPGPHGRNSLFAAISNANVRLLREYTGRGPTKARTTIRDNVVLVMLEQTLTKGEQILVEKGRGGNVLQLRREYQEAMRDEISAEIASLTGRNVVAMMSANHIGPDFAAEIFVLDGAPDHNHTPDRSADSHPATGSHSGEAVR